MKFQLNKHCILMLSALGAVAHVAGYRANDLRITAIKGGVSEADEASGFNGRLRMEIASSQSCGEFEAAAAISEEGTVVTNSYYLSQLPSIDSAWNCEVRGNKLHVLGGGQKYDFDIGEPAMFRYEPTFCESNIDLSGFASKIGQFGGVIKGFVNRKANAASTVLGAVRIIGKGQQITFEATNLSDAIYGELDLDAPTDKEWAVLLPIAQFDSWANLPHNAFPLMIGVDTDQQMTVRCGPIVVQHNTLTNLIDSMEDVSQLAGMFRSFNEVASLSDDELSELKFAMRYKPADLNTLVMNAVLFADGDPTLIIDSNTPDGGVNILVRTVTVDSKVELKDVEIQQGGQMSVNKGGLGLINKIIHLSGIQIDPAKPETYMVMRVIGSAVMVASPDGKWIAMTGESSI